MRPAQVVRRAAGYLERHDVDAPLVTAEQLLASVLCTDRVGIYRRSEPLNGQEAKAFGRALCRRCSGVPTQHLTGVAGFRRLTVEVRPGVFVPRPETEVVVEAALEEIAAARAPVVADIGTGTGVIALAIAQERPDATVWATDVSPAAVELARSNAARAGVDVTVVHGNLLDPLEPAGAGALDLVVSNPPYLEPEELEGLSTEVLADPAEALVGGVGVYQELFEACAARPRDGGRVVVEIGEDQGHAVTAAARSAGAASTEVRRDLAGRDRVVVARWP